MLTAGVCFLGAGLRRRTQVVAGPASEPGCFVPWGDKTKFFKFPAKK